MFKKKKIGFKSFKQQKYSKFSKIIGFISAFLIFLLGISIISQVSNINFDVSKVLHYVGFNLNFEQTDIQTTIKKSYDGKTNILLIGRGGQENDAPELTDSILLVSINYDKKTISMFSVPRDLYVKYPTGGSGKINETYSRALRKTKDQFEAIKSLQEVLGKITGEEIHYFVNIDFEGFRKIIDTIGGIEVNVPEDITDTSYPGPNHSYITFSIKSGLQTLDGEKALMYARSRHSTNDFDRSLRQQLIVKAIREKVLSLGLIANPSKIKSVYTIIKQHVVSDLDISQIIGLALFAKDIPKENIVSSNLNNSCFYGSSVCEKGGFLYVPDRDSFGGASVLLQNGGTQGNPSNYDSLVNYTNLVFNFPEIYAENMKINIFNSTKIGGLANDVAEGLKKYGFNIPKIKSIGNTKGEKFEKSVILYTGEKKPKTVEALEIFIHGGSQKVDTLPKYGTDVENQIEIIIGNDYKTLNF